MVGGRSGIYAISVSAIYQGERLFSRTIVNFQQLPLVIAIFYNIESGGDFLEGAMMLWRAQYHGDMATHIDTCCGHTWNSSLIFNSSVT